MGPEIRRECAQLNALRHTSVICATFALRETLFPSQSVPACNRMLQTERFRPRFAVGGKTSLHFLLQLMCQLAVSACGMLYAKLHISCFYRHSHAFQVSTKYILMASPHCECIRWPIHASTHTHSCCDKPNKFKSVTQFSNVAIATINIIRAKSQALGVLSISLRDSEMCAGK